MVTVEFDPVFEKRVRKIKDNALKERVKKQISKVVRYPLVGKPMRFSRKGAREVYVPPFRLSYLYAESKDAVVFLNLYHKGEQ